MQLHLERHCLLALFGLRLNPRNHQNSWTARVDSTPDDLKSRQFERCPDHTASPSSPYSSSSIVCKWATSIQGAPVALWPMHFFRKLPLTHGGTLRSILAWHMLVTLLLITSAAGQQSNIGGGGMAGPGPSLTSTTVSALSGSLTTATATTLVVNATSTPYVLNDSIAVRSTLPISNDTIAPGYFHLAVPQNQSTLPIFVALSLCSGPSDGVTTDIEANASSSDRRQLLQTTQSRLYVSFDNENQRPGSGDDPEGKADGFAYADGGYAQVALNEDGKREIQDVWIGVWPPLWNWGVTGSFQIEVVASKGNPVRTLERRYGISLDDTDTNSALLTSYNYTEGAPPNISLVVLPTSGSYSLPSLYYNSSFCAVSDMWNSFSNSSAAPHITASETSRGGTQLREGQNRRTQFEVTKLDLGTNYTAWLVDVNSAGRVNNNNVPSFVLFPAVKLLTKRTSICRLVYNVDFCPQVAYSIPVGPGVRTEDALSVINETVWPNYANFSRTMSTFPCDDPYFGQYSSVRSCVDCKRAYQDWLCAVTMPRCTDPLDDPETQSAAVLDVKSMTGRQSDLNTGLLPYVVNRNASTSRQKYFGDGLEVAETYGEILPCLYTCLFVQRNCPIPLLSWTCPKWDITAQADYGTFADSGHKGLGAALNGGAGSDSARWGGPLRYIAQDNFGKTYCSALGVDLFLRESNAALPSLRPLAQWSALVGVAVALLFAAF